MGELGVQWSMPALQDHHVPRLALQLTVIAGPCAEAGTTYVTKDDTTEVRPLQSVGAQVCGGCGGFPLKG